MNCCLCRKEAAKSSGLWDWKDPSFLAHPRLSWGTLTPRIFSSLAGRTRLLLAPSPSHPPSLHFPRLLLLQPWPLPLSIVIATQINILPPITFSLLVLVLQYLHPDLAFLILLPKWTQSEHQSSTLPSATAKLRRLCWPCKITPFKSSPLLPSCYLWSFIISHITPLWNTAVPPSTVCTSCTTSLCYVLCPGIFHVMSSCFPGPAHLAKPQARAKSSACIP